MIVCASVHVLEIVFLMRVCVRACIALHMVEMCSLAVISAECNDTPILLCAGWLEARIFQQFQLNLKKQMIKCGGSKSWCTIECDGKLAILRVNFTHKFNIITMMVTPNDLYLVFAKDKFC